MILPGFGIISEILPVFARQADLRLPGGSRAATVGIAFPVAGWCGRTQHVSPPPLSSVVLAFFMLLLDADRYPPPG